MTQPPTETSLEQLVREWEAELGPEEMTKARYQLRMRVLEFFLGLVVPVLFVVVWLPTGWAMVLRNALNGNGSWWGTWATLLLFLLSWVLLNAPMSWYFGFYVENRLGVNRQSLGGWIKDEIKQTGLSILLQSLLFLALYYVFRAWPQWWFLGMSVVVVVFLVVFYLLQPLVLRLKFRTRPLDAPELEARLRDLFQRAGVPFAGLAVVEAGEKTARSNAALIPRGTGTEVVLFDTLLSSLTPEAIEGVVAHELGHKVHRDLLKLMIFLGGGLLFALAIGYGVLTRLGAMNGLRGPGDVATFPLLLLVVSWMSSGLQILLNAFSRRIEFAADRFAVALTQNPQAFEEALRILVRQNKSLPQPPLWIERLLYSHPSPARRIQAIRRWASQSA